MKKTLGLILALIMVCSVVSSPIIAGASDYKVDDSTFVQEGFTVSDGLATTTTAGATATYKISDAGDAFAKLYIGANSDVTITIVASGFTYEKSAVLPDSKSYDLGCYTFKANDTITVTSNGNATIGTLTVTPVTATYLGTTDSSFEQSGLSSSGLVNFDGQKNVYNGNAGGTGYAKWSIPESLSGMHDIYFYYPKVSYLENGKYCDSHITFELADESGNITSWTYGGKNVPAGWQKIKTVDFSEKKYTSVKLISGGMSGTYIRVTGFKFVPNNSPVFSYLITAKNMEIFDGFKTMDSTYTDTYKKVFLYSEKSGATASSTFDVANGKYYTFVHSCDFPDADPATRNFYFNINGTKYLKQNTPVEGDAKGLTVNFGTHGYGGKEGITGATPVWDWEKSENTFEITDGKLDFEIHSNKSPSRVDAILITQDPFVSLSGVVDSSNSANTFNDYSPYEQQISFPEEYLGEHTATTATAVLSNQNTTVNFKLGTLSDGSTSVQRNITVGGTETVAYTDGLGFMVLRADSAIKQTENTYYTKFNTTFEKDGVKYTSNSANVFRAGKPEWLIPTTLVQNDSKTVTMTADGELASITAVWTLEENDKEPKVKVTAKVKQNGEYSFGFFNNTKEVDTDNVGYVLNPFRWQEKRVPENGNLIGEAYSTTNHTQMTYKQNASGQEITVGVAVDEEFVKRIDESTGEPRVQRWTQELAGYDRTNQSPVINSDGTTQEIPGFTVDYSYEQSEFGMNTTSEHGKILPAVFAPMMGTSTSYFNVDGDGEIRDTFEFIYRPLSTVSTSGENKGWYDCYNHVVKDLRGVYDFRDNYYASMTDTAFNLVDLIMNDEFGGWDDETKAHYNIEDTYWTSIPNGLIYMQNYLLSDDSEFLMKRTLPTMAAILTRDSYHMTSEYSFEGKTEGPINKEMEYSNNQLGNALFEGAYQLSRGQVPIYRNIAKQREMPRTAGFETAGLPEMKNATDLIWYDIANGDTSLTNAITYADKYLNERIFISASNYVGEDTFVNTSFTPNIHALLDMYEKTGEQKYLDGAAEAGRRFLPLLRATDMPSSKDEMYTVDLEKRDNNYKMWAKSSWWLVNENFRRGAIMSNGYAYDTYTEKKVLGIDKDNYVTADDTAFPFWVVSRVGLGLEQFDTCYKNNGNVLMSTWAGDLLRLGYLSDDQLMMDMARSAVVGRFANYPGYYLCGTYDETHGYANYPYECFDYTTTYFHHIPSLLANVQDYLFANAYVKSKGNIDFPYVRNLGFAWFNSRQYGAEAGTIYAETDMWPWLKKGTITISGTDAKQIDWLAGRKEGRGAFILTNASDIDQSITVTFNAELGIADGAIATVYDADGVTSSATITGNQLTLTISAKGITTVAVDGSGIHKPQYAKVKMEDIETGQDAELGTSAKGIMYEGNTYKSAYNGSKLAYSTETGYDVKAYALSLDNTGYMGYIFVGGRSTDVKGGDGDKGILNTTLTWHYDGDDTVNTITDTTFPFEFYIPVDDATKKIKFNVSTTFGNGDVKSLAGEHLIAPNPVSLAEDTENGDFEPVLASGYFFDNLNNVSASDAFSNENASGLKFTMPNDATRTGKFDFDIEATDALKGCHLSGYLVALDDESTTDVDESGYVLFDNAEIKGSYLRGGNKILIYVENYRYLATRQFETDASGNKLGPKQGIVNGWANYDKSNFYITDASNDNILRTSKDGNTYTLTCGGAKQVTVAIATYDGTRMTDIELSDVIVSINNDKVLTLEDNQKLFVWQKDMYKPLTMKPLFNVLTK